jgi:integrase
VVAAATQAAGGAHAVDEGPPVPQSKRRKTAHPQVVDGFHRAARSLKNFAPTYEDLLLYAGRKSDSEFKKVLRAVEAQTDINVSIRMKYLREAQSCSTGKRAVWLAQSLRRLKRQCDTPRYSIFYDVKPIVSFAFFAPVTKDLPSDLLLDRSLLALRLSTLMRSVDVQNVVSGIFSFNSEFFVRTIDKNGTPRAFSVGGTTLLLLLEYMARVASFPATTMFRHLNAPQMTLSAERIAKRQLAALEALGVDTSVFKAHSLRGATATQLLRDGCPQRLVQSRGGWSSPITLDKYYARLHQHVNWEAMRASGEAQGNSSRSAFAPKTAEAEPTEEGGSPGGEETKAQRLEYLNARGLLRPLHGGGQCPSCGRNMNTESCYSCKACRRHFHVRCPSPVDHGTFRPYNFG